jgi:hypothetical protein
METTTVKFEGHSDDTFGAYWKGGDVDHDDCANMSMRVMHVKAGEDQMLVTGIYAPASAATWVIGIAPADEDQTIPPWPMRWSFSGYSAILELDLPEGFEITLILPKKEDDE